MVTKESKRLELKEYLDVDVRTLRKCPRCGSRHYERSLEYNKVKVYNNGKLENSWDNWDDSGSTWTCLDCKLNILQNGEWENA